MKVNEILDTSQERLAFIRVYRSMMKDLEMGISGTQIASPIGELFRARRKEAGLSQADVARRAKLDQTTIGKVELGKFPAEKTIFRIGRALSIPEKLIREALPVWYKTRPGPGRPPYRSLVEDAQRQGRYAAKGISYLKSALNSLDGSHYFIEGINTLNKSGHLYTSHKAGMLVNQYLQKFNSVERQNMVKRLEAYLRQDRIGN